MITESNNKHENQQDQQHPRQNKQATCGWCQEPVKHPFTAFTKPPGWEAEWPICIDCWIVGPPDLLGRV